MSLEIERPPNPTTQPVPLCFARVLTYRVFFYFYLFLYSLLGSFSIGLLKLTKIQLDFCLPSALFILLSSSSALCFIVSFPFVAFVALFQSLLLLLFLFLAACAARVKLFSKIYDEIVSNFLISSHVAYNLTVPLPWPLPLDGACLVRL